MVVVTVVPSSPPRATSPAPLPPPPSPPHSIAGSNDDNHNHNHNINVNDNDNSHNSNNNDNDNDNDNECCLDEFTLRNGRNFGRSEAPTRIMFYMNDWWEDFKGEVLESLRSSFSGGKSLLTLEIEGAMYAFDFLRMLQIHLASENHRSIAWIDAKGKPFFPARFLGHDFSQSPKDATRTVQAQIAADRKGKRKMQPEEVADGDGPKRQSLEPLTSKFPNAKLLSKSDKTYAFNSNLFLSNIGKHDPNAVVTDVHELDTSGSFGREWCDDFEKQIEVTKAVRGEANVVYAWFAAPAETVAFIFSHGFQLLSDPPIWRPSLGAGIFLADVESPHYSAMQYYQVDRKAERHLILCRVVLGSMERVDVECHQTCPTCEVFDTGVNDLVNPEWYVVWSSDINRRILPVSVVTCKTNAVVPAEWRLYKHETTIIPRLILELRKRVPLDIVPVINAVYDSLKKGEVTTEKLMKQLKAIAGKELLTNTAKEFVG